MTDINLWLCAGLVASGIVGNLLLNLYKLEQAGTILSPLAYIRMHPYQYAVMVLFAYLLLAMTYFMGQLNYVVAITVGVLADQAHDTLRAREVGKLRADYTEPGSP